MRTLWPSFEHAEAFERACRALRLVQVGDDAAAAEYCRYCADPAAVDTPSGRWDAHRLLGAIHARAGRLAEAEASFEAAMREVSSDEIKYPLLEAIAAQGLKSLVLDQKTPMYFLSLITHDFSIPPQQCSCHVGLSHRLSHSCRIGIWVVI